MRFFLFISIYLLQSNLHFFFLIYFINFHKHIDDTKSWNNNDKHVINI